MPEIKQFGLHRSGTNFLRVILQENYVVTVLMNEGGWKHGFYDLPRRLGREVDCMLCVKDPYAWLHSFYRYRHPTKAATFQDFVRAPITVEPDCEDRNISAANPVELWVQMYEHWLSVNLRERSLFLFRYEEVLADPRSSIQELVAGLGLQRRLPWHARWLQSVGLTPAEPAFFLPKKSLQPLQDNYKGRHLKKGSTFDPNQYTRRKYLEAFTPELLGFVNERLKADLLKRLGYQTVTAEALAVG